MDATAADVPPDAPAAAEKNDFDENRGDNNVPASSRSSLIQQPENVEKPEPRQPEMEAADQEKDVELGAEPAAERVVTTESARKRRLHRGHVNDLSSVPNGGLTAWLQVAGAFVLFFNSWVSCAGGSTVSAC
jgi:hypothetical protein